MNATNKQGHEWTGERQDGYWLYVDFQEQLYESLEAPAYRITMNQSCTVLINGKRTICPINPTSP